jgi:hypothetical protein
MAEKTILVCDACGRPAAETVTIKLARGNFVKDLCATHVNELIGGARRPRRGRPRGAVAPSPRSRARTAKRTAPSKRTATSKRTGTKRSGSKRTGAKRGARRRPSSTS